MREDCIVCRAFPNHKGQHYTSREATRILFSQRGHLPGAVQWTPLPAVWSAAGNRILLTTHTALEPEAHPAEGMWLLEQQGDLVGKREYSGELHPSANWGPPPSEPGPPEPEGGGATVYVNWAGDGLRVEVSAVLGPRAQRHAEKLRADLKQFWTDDGVRATQLDARTDTEVRVSLTASRGRQARLCLTLGNLLEVLTQHQDPERVVVTRGEA
jgi:hypothetical protein